MAKIRRVVRKLKNAGEQAFDDQLWPVYVALVIFGAFLVGVNLAYLRFDDPRWFANGWTWLLGTPLVVGGTMFLLRYVSNRLVRRTMQLAVVVSLAIHVALIVGMLEIIIFHQVVIPEMATNDLWEAPTIPDYVFNSTEEREQAEFEQPVETITPEPEPQEVEREKPPEEEITPPQPQPEPVPEVQPTVRPQEVQRNQPTETAPRQSDQAAQLSRQTAQARPRTADSVAVPQAAPQPTAARPEPNAQAAAVARRETETQINRPQVDQPTTETVRENVEISRRPSETQPTPESTSAPTLTRAQAQPQAVPRAAQPVEAVAAAPRQTDPAEVAPNTIAPERTSQAAPELTAEVSSPNSETPTPAPTAAATPTRRPSTEPAPQVTAAPSATASPRAQSVPTPQVTAQAAEVQPTQSPNTAPTEAPIQPQTNPVPRATADLAATRHTTIDTPNTSTAPAVEPVVTRQPTATPAPTVETSPAPATTARVATRPTPNPSAVAEVTTPNPATTPTSGQNLSPASTATVRQPTAAPQSSTASPATSAPAVETVGPTLTRNAPQRAESPSADAPTVARNPSRTPTQRADRAPGMTTTQSAVAEVSGAVPTTSPAAASLTPATAAVTRQNAAAPTSTSTGSTPTPSDAPTPGAAVAEAARPTPRATASAAAPSIRPQDSAAPQPARATRNTPNAVSPQPVESPAGAVAQRSTSRPDLEPARPALSRAVAGVAGVGGSPNLDRGTGAPDAPALVASASASRAEASQTTPNGPAIAPSAAAQVSRARAAAEAPSSSLQAQNVEVATAGGVAQPTELTASSSAALTSAASNAARGELTASQGSTEVDLGPTRTVAESGTSRASGGGQPELNMETQARRVARRESGGGPQASLQVALNAEAAAAPPAEGGGSPPSLESNPASASLARTELGGGLPTTGGPAEAADPGELASAATGQPSPATELARAGDAGGEPSLDGDPEETEEERRRRLARARAGGAPQIASVAVPLEAPSGAPPAAGGEAGGPSEPTAQAVAAARVPAGAAAPAGGPSAAAAQGPASQVAAAQMVGESRLSRAAAGGNPAEGPQAAAAAGSPGRSRAAGPPAANQLAAAVEVPGAPSSSGEPSGTPLLAQGTAAAKASGGAIGPATPGPVGALAGEVVVDAAPGAAAGPIAGRRDAGPAGEPGPSLATASQAGAPLPRAGRTGLPSSTSVAAAEVPDMSGMPAAEEGVSASDLLAYAGEIGPMSRQTLDGAIVVRADAPQGPGGLGDRPALNTGHATRRAQRDSPNTRFDQVRFLTPKHGGELAINTSAVVAADSFRGRLARRAGDTEGGSPGRPSPKTEEAIERGLGFLANHQSPDGSWSLHRYAVGKPGAEQETAGLPSDTAATGMALLAFQGAGYHHKDYKYRDTVANALAWLVKNQKDDGDLFVPVDGDANRSVWLYSHGIAAIALCEAYGMTQDPALREPAQKSLDFIAYSQQPERGGWRYSPQFGADTSVSGWMMMALKSGELAGLDVPAETYEGVTKWLDRAQASDSNAHLYVYNPYAPDTVQQRHGRDVSPTMTAVGLLMRLYSGWSREDPRFVKGVEYLMKSQPAYGTRQDPLRDTYYWYYATQVVFHMGGKEWEAWNAKLQPLLNDTQVLEGPYAGSWDPRNPVPDRWGPHGGRIYVTALNLLNLEVQYRHLPLYLDTAK